MIKYYNAMVVFEEIPNEITLAINITNCPCHCKGCHSKFLWEDVGTELDGYAIDDLVKKNNGVTCVCFMGGDADVSKLYHFAAYVHSRYGLKVAWYTGMALNPNNNRVMDVIKKAGGLENDADTSSRHNKIILEIKGVQ